MRGLSWVSPAQDTPRPVSIQTQAGVHGVRSCEKGSVPKVLAQQILVSNLRVSVISRVPKRIVTVHLVNRKERKERKEKIE